jgi:hypothetical protein
VAGVTGTRRDGELPGINRICVVSTGLSRGIIRQNMFVMFVVMTLVTTIMTGPLLSWLTVNGTGSSGLRERT